MELLSEVREEVNDIGTLTDLTYGWKESSDCCGENIWSKGKWNSSIRRRRPAGTQVGDDGDSDLGNSSVGS